jgi:signal transduction histidine kinase
LILEIRDNGPGLPENFEIQRGVRYVMQPSGGGMGLYNARQALKAFDGILSHENGVPGALFRIALQQSTKKTNQNLELRPE